MSGMWITANNSETRAEALVSVAVIEFPVL